MKRKAAKTTDARTLPMPTSWQADFRAATMRTGFFLNLSQPMLEYLCAVADDCMWDRGLYYHQLAGVKPDNWIASRGALEKRGLVRRKSDEQLKKEWNSPTRGEYGEGPATYELTPIGEAFANVLKVAGMFVEQDAAIIKRCKNA